MLERFRFLARVLGSAVAISGVAVAAGAAAPAVAPKVAERPSVVLITLDTTRADHLGCYGAAFASTPNLNALAKAGVRFNLALSPAPLTFPSHVSLMTGLVPRRHGVRDNAGFRLGGRAQVLAERLKAAGYATTAFVSAAVLDGKLGLARGFDRYDDTVRIGDREAFDYQERAAGQTTLRAIEALSSLKPPFFLWVHYYDPHLPYVPPEPFRSRFKDRPYDGEIAYMDAEVGKLLAAVRKRVGAPLVIVAGDHGESLGEHGEDAHGVFVYQATQRVPLILAGPGVPAGKAIGRNVGLVDVAPTLLDLLGLPPLAGVDGRSLARLFRSAADPTPDYEMESMFPAYAYGWSPLRALVSGARKVVDAPRVELYDLPSDPSERRDLAKVDGRRADALVASLRERVRGDVPIAAPADDPELAEQRRRLESLGYVGGSSVPQGGDVVDPKDGIAWLSDLEAGRRAAQTGKPRDGIAPLERLLSKNPRNVPALLALTQCRLGAGDTDKAIETIVRARDLAPDNALIYFHLGNALAVKARTDPKAKDAARDAYERSLALNPRSAEAWLNFLAFLGESKDGAGMRRLLDRAEKEGIQDPDLAADAGLLRLADGDTTGGTAALDRALALNPRQPLALEAMGKLAYERKDFKAAESYYARALDAEPSAALAKTLGAIRLYDLQDRDGARDAFRRALALSPPGDPETADLREMLRDLDAGGPR